MKKLIVVIMLLLCLLIMLATLSGCAKQEAETETEEVMEEAPAVDTTQAAMEDTTAAE